MFEVSASPNAYCAYTPASTDPVITIQPAIETGWIGFIYMFQAIIDPTTAWQNAQTLPGYDNGNSKTNTLYWIATRANQPAQAPKRIGRREMRRKFRQKGDIISSIR